MDTHRDYLMEHDDETRRLEIKTNVDIVHQQARWAGLKPGMRVVDVGCGPGKTTRALFDVAGPEGMAVGIDIAPHRIAFAKENYSVEGIQFEHRNALKPLDDLGQFDFIWVRFVLEYHRSRSFDIVKNLTRILKPGGILCLIDLDHNCLNHFGLPDKLSNTLRGVMCHLEKIADFDPHAGIKLYSFLYDLGYADIDATMAPHHLIFGKLNEVDEFNWTKKVQIAVRQSGYAFSEYPGGYEEFYQAFVKFFADPRRFTYTPLIACRGRKP
jgi:ubiquinone/menaquinone biosynthesis C-methylase UbiE